MAINKPKKFGKSQDNSAFKHEQTPTSSSQKIVRTAITVVVIIAAIFVVINLGEVFYSLLVGVALTYTGIRNIPWAIENLGLMEPAIVGAFTGIVIGWFRRGLHVRDFYHETFISSLTSSRFWCGNPGHAVFLFVIHGITGCLVGVIFSSAGAFTPRETILNNEYLMHRIGVILEIPGAGGFDNDIFTILSLLIVAVIIALIVFLLLNKILTLFIMHTLFKSGVGSFAKYLLSTCVEEWPPRIHWDCDKPSDIKEVMSIALVKSLSQGLVTGVIVGLVLVMTE